MPHEAALPFILKRGDDVFSSTGMTSTRETVHGLLILETDRLVIQWRVGRKTEHLRGDGMRTDQEVEPVQEIVVPLWGIAGAVVRRTWWNRLIGPRLVLTAADLRAFEGVTGGGGLSLDHPAELVLRLRRSDGLAAEEFSAELALAVAERSVRGAAERRTLEAGRPAEVNSPRLPPSVDPE